MVMEIVFGATHHNCKVPSPRQMVTIGLNNLIVYKFGSILALCSAIELSICARTRHSVNNIICTTFRALEHRSERANCAAAAICQWPLALNYGRRPGHPEFGVLL